MSIFRLRRDPARCKRRRCHHTAMYDGWCADDRKDNNR